MSDITTRMVYETEGRHGGDVRGWHGQRAYDEAMEREREEYLREQARQGHDHG